VLHAAQVPVLIVKQTPIPDSDNLADAAVDATE
jgi:hypothetical protein